MRPSTMIGSGSAVYHWAMSARGLVKKMHTIDQRYLIFENNINKARNQEII